MQPTVPPWAWMPSWERRARTRAAGEFARSRDRAAPRARDHDKYALYGLRKDSRHFIRLDPLAKGLLLNRQWAATNAPVTWRVERAHRTEPWAVPDIKSIQSYRPYEPVPIVPGQGLASLQRTPGGMAAPRMFSNAAGGWAAGAVLLALLVLIARAAENCLHKKLLRAVYANTIRRQESDEWSTPNVMATTLQLQHRDFDTGSQDDLGDIEELPPLGHSDLPPPYSECARPGHKPARDEPPPPYSACYVAYTGPKEAEPQVHIRRQYDLNEPAHSSTDVDNAQNNLIENGLRSEAVTMTTSSYDSEDAPEMRTELVFDNGRIVERMSLDPNSNNNETGAASIDIVEEQSTRHAEFTDRVVYIDETAAENTPDRALLV